MNPSVDLGSLAARLDRLEAERDIVEVIQRYSTAIDDGLDEEWVDCFTVDGIFEVKTLIGVTFQVRGHVELKSFIVGHTKAPQRWHKHLTSAHRIKLDGAMATVQSTIVRIDSDEEGIPKI